MIKKLTVILILILLTVSCASCAKSKSNRYEAQFLELFDTMSQLVIYADTKEKSEEISQFIYNRLKEYHQLYDIYNSYEGINNLKTVNDQAGKAPVKVDRRIIDLLLYAKEEYKVTKGKMNVAFGAVLKIWHDYRTEGIDDPDNAKLPPTAQLQEAALHCDINRIIIDEVASTVFLDDPLMSLDVGAIAKGYSTEQVCRAAEQNGTASALVSIGGNVRAIGGKEDGQPWKVGIQNPGDVEDAKLPMLNLTQMSLVTSGNYERYYTVNGENYHHIIDPVTLFPSEYCTAVTILCKDSGRADALSTAVFNMPFEEGLQLIESLADTEALWIMPNGDIKSSSGFDKYISK